MTPRCLGAIGGNTPINSLQPTDVVSSGLRALGRRFPGSLTVSALYRTPAFPPGAGPDFVNAAFELVCDLPPEEILAIFHEIEAEHERTRKERWAGRTLDIDLLAVGGQVLPDRVTWDRWHALPSEAQQRETPDRLILPHPRLSERAFVLVPLMDVAPGWRHPVLGRTVAEMCVDLPAEDVDSVVKIADPPCV